MLVYSVLVVGLIAAPVVPSLAQEKDKPVPPSGTKCPPVPGRNATCVCRTGKGIIDLTPISNSDGTPKFAGIQDDKDFSYTYNPCQPFQTQGETGCEKTHICQAPNNDPNQFYDVAEPGTEVMYIDTDGAPYLYYTGPDNRDTRVYLTCDKSADTPIATTEGDSTTPLSYVFHIIAKECCPTGSDKSNHVQVPIGEIGIGIICGILPCALIVYIVVGIVVMKYRYKATGSDVIPNKGFWTALPLLVKDGCVFSFSPLSRLIRGKAKGYDSVDAD